MDFGTFFAIILSCIAGALGMLVYMNYTARQKRQRLIKKLVMMVKRICTRKLSA